MLSKTKIPEVSLTANKTQLKNEPKNSGRGQVDRFRPKHRKTRRYRVEIERRNTFVFELPERQDECQRGHAPNPEVGAPHKSEHRT